MLYSYEAFDKNGVAASGEIDASSDKDLILILEQKGLTPSKIKAKGKVNKGIGVAVNSDIFAKIKDEDRIFMVRNLIPSRALAGTFWPLQKRRSRPVGRSPTGLPSTKNISHRYS